jgi:hypothetical protein
MVFPSTAKLGVPGDRDAQPVVAPNPLRRASPAYTGGVNRNVGHSITEVKDVAYCDRSTPSNLSE